MFCGTKTAELWDRLFSSLNFTERKKTLFSIWVAPLNWHNPTPPHPTPKMNTLVLAPGKFWKTIDWGETCVGGRCSRCHRTTLWRLHQLKLFCSIYITQFISDIGKSCEFCTHTNTRVKVLVAFCWDPQNIQKCAKIPNSTKKYP